jgi:hypothetical protein
MPIQNLCLSLALLQNSEWTGGTFLPSREPVIFLPPPPEAVRADQGFEEKTRLFLGSLRGAGTAYPGARPFNYGGSAHDTEEAAIWYYGFVGFFDPQRVESLRAVVAPFFTVDDDLFLVKSAAEFLGLCCMDRVMAAPL